MPKKYIVGFSDGETVKKISVLPSVVKQIHNIRRAPNYDKDHVISLDKDHECSLRQIRTISTDTDSEPLMDSSRLLAQIDVEALDEKQMREGWHRALCIAIGHGVRRDSPLIKKYCEKYDIDIDALYPVPCPVCRTPQQ